MQEYNILANEIRKTVLKMIHEAGTSHIASNLSVIDLAVVLYENLKEEDIVVWSKGWAAATIYALLAHKGIIPKKDLDTYCKPGSKYIGLAENSIKGVVTSGGSMGHGLPVSVGIALSRKREGKKGNVYCIMSDGEMNCGTTWESSALAHYNKLDNIVVLIDKNGWQAMGRTEDILDIDIKKAFEGFGWFVSVIDGHDHLEIKDCMDNMNDFIGVPKVIICNTIKGKGVSFMENHNLFHYKHIDKETYDKAMKELCANSL